MTILSLLKRRRPHRDLKVVALLAMRNEKLYVERCIEHLVSQGIEIYILDNDSTDGSLDLVQSYLGNGVLGVERFPCRGTFDLEGQMERKEQLALEIQADWFLHHDCDEIREAPPPYRTLREGIADADARGFNAINFDEFVFVPTSAEGSFEGKDYVREMKYYYYFKKRNRIRRLNAWKKRKTRVNLRDRMGHAVKFEGRKILPEDFVMRHYIMLSLDHGVRKYCTRRFPRKALAKGQHKERANLTPERIVLPPRESLKEYRNDGVWDRTDPQKKHFLFT